MEKYLDYTLVGVVKGKAVYNHPTRGLAIERDHLYLVDMTAEEKAIRDRQQQDAAMLARLKDEREQAERITQGIFHACGNPRCLNPDHLDIVTLRNGIYGRDDNWFAEGCEAEKEATLRNGSGV